jgi:hypothetical protein
MRTIETIELDRVPTGEDSLTSRRDWRPILAQLEARLFRRQIIQQFGKDNLEANSVSVRVKIHYGNYTEPEVVINYDLDNGESTALAYQIEMNCWTKWSAQSARILKLASSLTEEQLENAKMLDNRIILNLLGYWE